MPNMKFELPDPAARRAANAPRKRQREIQLVSFRPRENFFTSSLRAAGKHEGGRDPHPSSLPCSRQSSNSSLNIAGENAPPPSKSPGGVSEGEAGYTHLLTNLGGGSEDGHTPPSGTPWDGGEGGAGYAPPTKTPRAGAEYALTLTGPGGGGEAEYVLPLTGPGGGGETGYKVPTKSPAGGGGGEAQSLSLGLPQLVPGAPRFHKEPEFRNPPPFSVDDPTPPPGGDPPNFIQVVGSSKFYTPGYVAETAPPPHQVCHHEDCQAEAGRNPLYLCRECDTNIHKEGQSSGHLRFDLYRLQADALRHHGSTHSLPREEADSSATVRLHVEDDDDDDDEEDDDDEDYDDDDVCSPDDDVGDAEDDVDCPDIKRNLRLRRKKVLKNRRHPDEHARTPLLPVPPPTLAASLAPPPVVHGRSRSCEGLSRLRDARPPWSVELLRDPSLSSADSRDRSSSFSERDVTRRPCAESPESDDVTITLDGAEAEAAEAEAAEAETAAGQGERRGERERRRTGGEREGRRTGGERSRHHYNRMASSPALLHGHNFRLRQDADGGSESSPTLTSRDPEDKLFRNGDVAATGRRHREMTPTQGQGQAAGPSIKKQRTDSGSSVAVVTSSNRRKYSVPNLAYNSAAKIADRKVAPGTECFTVRFDIVEELTKGADQEMVPAIKGVTLRAAVSSFLENRGLTFEMVDFFIASSQSALQVDTADCYFLAGAQLHVRAKQSAEFIGGRHGSITSSRSVPGGGSRISERRVNKTSRPDYGGPDTPSPHNTLRGSQAHKGIGKLFGSSNKKPDILQSLLHSYAENGLPPMPELLTMGRKRYPASWLHLESSWVELVENTQGANRYQQEAIWELIKTETAYMRDLQLVINLFMACLYNLQEAGLLNEIETEKIFSNLVDIQQANCHFWETHMVQVVELSRVSRLPLDPEPLIKGFSDFKSYFEPYSKFCLEYMSCQHYLSKMKDENELFRTFLSWAENRRECHRLSLRDYIGKPFQRLTKYKLLLERIWREPRPDNVNAMVDRVDSFICRINAQVTQREIMKRIDSYDVVDVPSNNDTLSKLVSAHSDLDLRAPMAGCGGATRFLIDEGVLRMNNRTECVCFLFTDMFLVTKCSRKGDAATKPRVKVIRPPMRLDKVHVAGLSDGGMGLVYLNEYHLVTAACTFHGDHSRAWLDRIRAAQIEFRRLQQAQSSQAEAKLFDLAANGLDEAGEDNAFLATRTRGAAGPSPAHARPPDPAPEGGVLGRNPSISSAEGYLGTVFEVPSSGGGGYGGSPEAGDFRPRSATDPEPLHSRSTLSVQDPASCGRSEGSRSPPGSPPAGHTHKHNTNNNSGVGSVRPDDAGGQTLDLARSSSNSSRQSSGSDRTPSSAESQPDPAAPSGPVLPDNYSTARLHQDLRKLKQRRDKRYFTADMIHDLQQGKDASIQKRLSWHSGNKDSDYDYKQGAFRRPPTSTDSLRSALSNSSVSSGVSLQGCPEGDICEEESGSHNWSEDTGTQSGDSAPMLPKDTSDENQVRFAITIATDDASEPDKDSRKSLSRKSRNVSKSMPDISQLAITGEDGEDHSPDSVARIREGQKRKLSPFQNQKLQLLLNSTLEATDV